MCSYVALPQIRAAIDPSAKGGDYYGPAGITETSGFPVLVTSSTLSHNQELQGWSSTHLRDMCCHSLPSLARFWEYSKDKTATDFDAAIQKIASASQ